MVFGSIGHTYIYIYHGVLSRGYWTPSSNRARRQHSAEAAVPQRLPSQRLSLRSMEQGVTYHDRFHDRCRPKWWLYVGKNQFPTTASFRLVKRQHKSPRRRVAWQQGFQGGSQKRWSLGSFLWGILPRDVGTLFFFAN